MNRLILFLLFFLSVNLLYGQHILTPEELKDSARVKNAEVVQMVVEAPDTILIKNLRPVLVMPPYKFKSKRQEMTYSKLLYNVRKVYPYSKIVKRVYAEIEDSLSKITNEDQRKVYIKAKEKELRGQFENELIHLTITQGKILIKLVDRETGNTTYQVIQELKGGFSAFIWQGVARLFGSNLKSEYDADEEDKMIEDIILRIENGLL
ncbi:MAG: DUF4294 domain-containing protein [Bacteroidales bacterium]|nr:DUF4294 domain-containing protein [Bacteroidales bacterium]